MVQHGYREDSAAGPLGVLWDYLDGLELQQVLYRLVLGLQGDGILGCPLSDDLAEPREEILISPPPWDLFPLKRSSCPCQHLTSRPYPCRAPRRLHDRLHLQFTNVCPL